MDQVDYPVVLSQGGYEKLRPILGGMHGLKKKGATSFIWKTPIYKPMCLHACICMSLTTE